MQQRVEEENKELKKKVLELEVAFHHIDWELEVLCEFLENKGLTDEAAKFVAERFAKFVDENNDYISA